MTTNLISNGNFSQGYTDWIGFLNTVNAPTPSDDLYVNKPFTNLKLIPTGVQFVGFFDPAGPGSYSYRLAPASPHLNQVVNLEAGKYTLNFDIAVNTSGMNLSQKFEVKLDGVQIDAESLWTQKSNGLYSAADNGTRTVTLNVANSGNHTLSFGFSAPGYNIDTAGSYVQYANKVTLNNVILTAETTTTPTVPTPTISISISGLAQQNQTLNTTNNIVNSSSVSYQWLANDVVIPNATASTYTLTQTDVNKNITVTATYLDALGISQKVTSSATGIVTNVNDVPTGNVIISGVAQQNQVLTASNTLNDIDGLGTINYQWFANNVAIPNAITSTYTLTQAEVGKSITVSASYIDGFGTQEVVTSASTNTVATLPVVDMPMTLIGTAGVDILNGGNANDTLKGLGGIDKMNGGNGSDIYVITNPTEHTTGEINDTGITGTDEIQFISSVAGSLTLFANDIGLEKASVSNTTVALNINANALSNGIELIGNNGTNSLTGSAFADTIRGNAGNDNINAGAGNDTVFGGLGVDNIDGGAGADVFSYANTSESNRSTTDIVKNVDLAVDKFHFDNLTITKANLLNVITTQMSSITALQSTLNSTILPLNSAVLMHVTSGVAMNTNLLFVNADSVAGYQTGSDYAIQLTGLVNLTSFGIADFI